MKRAGHPAWARRLGAAVIGIAALAGLLGSVSIAKSRFEAESARRQAAEVEQREQQLARDLAKMRADEQAAKQVAAEAAAQRAAEAAAEKARAAAERAEEESARAVQEALRRAEAERAAKAVVPSPAKTPVPAATTPLKLLEAKCTGSCHQLSMFTANKVPAESATYVVDRMARQKGLSLTAGERRTIIGLLSE